MTVPPTRERLAIGWLCTTTALVSVTGLFAFAHWQHWRRTGEPQGLCFAAQEIAVVVVALVRRRPAAVSRRPGDWLWAVVGSYVVLLLRPGGTPPVAIGHLGTAMQVVGAVLAAVCLLELGRSFGVVAANRGIKTRGPYGIVRHPIYAAYAVATTGYLLAAPTAWNTLIVGVAFAAQLRRIAAEESLLATRSEYCDYAQRVRWRLIPRVL